MTNTTGAAALSQRHADETGQSAPSRPQAGEATVLEQQINENLRRLYQPTLEEAIPDHLQQLLQRLKGQGVTQEGGEPGPEGDACP